MANYSETKITMKREELNILLTEWEQFKKANWYHSDAIDVEKYLMGKFAEIKAFPLPPAEGAEEMPSPSKLYFDLCTEYLETLDRSQIVEMAMLKFATLHAQQMAEKMAEERLREELIKYSMYASEQWCDTSDRELSEKNIDTYLKSKER